MNLAILIDGPSALIVLGGTLLATWLRAGNRDCARTLARLTQLGRARFDAEGTRAELSRQVQEIRRDGLLRASAHHYADEEFEDATGAMLGARSVGALLDRHAAHKARRLASAERAVRTLAQAAELAPVFGLAGTLVSLSQLPADGLARGAFAGAIAMAVVTTLYGLLLSNLVLAPLARMVERAAQAEEAERQQMIDWLAGQVSDAAPPPRSEHRAGHRDLAA
ncbi:MAG: MotA/TolQ/ExbB proton channel family protein [Novosphingobium sp.]|uniref:MotA/TolQ/ExbB proton channel family protein n=1 Tax=Novosphingobium sp. TaxID=1874826 RepID=UPI001D725473|nr:MotA/TolQ/ExbB proton channel family protein [Novosphingobium sp.]MCB2058587.1 MotA/TolQ/ExbB proton channel family protein [Novosphingobium sp.]MCP5385622.1 MotA/TolQ/ExbB proton channel family protein [Novosphingobium sp.]